MGLEPVSGNYRQADDSLPEEGSLTFRPPEWWVNEEGEIVTAVPVTRALVDGDVLLLLERTLIWVDDPYFDAYFDAYYGGAERIAPAYRVDESIDGIDERYYIDVPPGGTELAKAKPWQ